MRHRWASKEVRHLEEKPSWGFRFLRYRHKTRTLRHQWTQVPNNCDKHAVISVPIMTHLRNKHLMGQNQRWFFRNKYLTSSTNGASETPRCCLSTKRLTASMQTQDAAPVTKDWQHPPQFWWITQIKPLTVVSETKVWQQHHEWANLVNLNKIPEGRTFSTAKFKHFW